MAFPLWDSFQTSADAEKIDMCTKFKEKLEQKYAREKDIFENNEEEIANLELVLKTAIREREKIEFIYKNLCIEVRSVKTAIKHINAGSPIGPDIISYSGYDAII